MQAVNRSTFTAVHLAICRSEAPEAPILGPWCDGLRSSHRLVFAGFFSMHAKPLRHGSLHASRAVLFPPHCLSTYME